MAITAGCVGTGPHQALHCHFPGHPALDSVLATLGTLWSLGKALLLAALWPPAAGWRAGGWAGRQNITPKINEEEFQALLDYSFY